MARIEIKHFDNLVHPDYDLRLDSRNPLPSLDRLAMREAWLDRIFFIAGCPDRALFYFSDYLTGESDFGFEGLRFTRSYNQEAFAAEKHRLYTAHELLGPRLICFSGYELPTNSSLGRRLVRHGLIYSSDTASLTSYGMYTELCVDAKHGALMWGLSPDSRNCSIDRKLSIPAPFIDYNPTINKQDLTLTTCYDKLQQ